MVRAKKDSCPVKPIVGVFNSGAEVLDFQNSRPRDMRLAELRDLVRGQLQDLACQMAVGEPKFIQYRKVVRLCDRDQVTGKMRL